MAMKSAAEEIAYLKTFIPNAKKAIAQFEEMQRLLETQEEFRKLWESNSADALRQVGINPDARVEMGKEPYPEGVQCNYCITPQGNACHC